MALIDRMIRTAPVQERFGPSLPQLIASRVGRMSRTGRRIAAIVVVIIAAVLVAALWPRGGKALFEHTGAPASFTVTWTSAMTREPAGRGSLLRLVTREERELVASFVITPLALPRYAGEVSGLLPVIAINDERRLAQRYGARFSPWSLGRTRIINTPAFQYTYQLRMDGHTYYGRRVFITPDLSGDRTGLILSALQLPSTLNATTAPSPPTPDAVGTGGPVQQPLEHLHIG